VGIRLIIAEDNYLVREGVTQLLQAVDDVEVVAVCEDFDALVAAVESERPDVVLTDIQAACRRSVVTASVEARALRRYHPALEAAVYFSCVEALQNAAKHAGKGATACVRLREEDGMLVFEVSDDGAGFEAAAVEAGAGLTKYPGPGRRRRRLGDGALGSRAGDPAGGGAAGRAATPPRGSEGSLTRRRAA